MRWKTAIGVLLIPAMLLFAQAGPQFEVASVKPHPAADRDGGIGPYPGGFKATGMPLKVLIEIAYRLRDYQIAGNPVWVDEDHFDVEARAKTGMNPSHEELQKMMQGLLAERFGLKAHWEKRELPALAIVVAKGGPKLAPARVKDADTPELSVSHGFIRGNGITTAGLADAIGMESDRAVVDRTGLSGKFDVSLKWSPVISDAADVPLVTAIQELGLRLEPTKAQVDVLVIDSVRKPSEN